MEEHRFRLVSLMMRRGHDSRAARRRGLKQDSVALPARRLLDPNPRMRVSRRRRNRDRWKLHAERIREARCPGRFLSGRCPELVIDMDQ